MLNFFRGKPACPVDVDQQHWVDGRFRWLQDQLGEQTPLKLRVILPTPEFFPDPYQGRPEDAQAMLVRVAGYMNIDPSRFKLFLYSNDEAQGTAGLYIRGDGDTADSLTRIGIESTKLADPMALVATLAHEIGHEILLGQNRVSRDQNDHEPLTDLLTVFLGMGIFMANSTIRDGGWSTALVRSWQTSRLGYLDQRMFGYALARFAWTRGETNPAWIRHIRPDVRSPMKQGLRFLAGSDGE